LQVDHGSQIEVLTQFFGGSSKLRVIDPIYVFLDADNFLHDIDTFFVLALS
jgi:hypothetical protein